MFVAIGGGGLVAGVASYIKAVRPEIKVIGVQMNDSDAMIQSVVNIQTAYAKALLVDEARLAEAQHAGDVLGAHRILVEAFETDVRPLLGRLRQQLGIVEDPVAVFRDGGYAATLARERGVASIESAYERL